MRKGLVIIGYQGIGKSSIAGWRKCIDLESGNFFVGGNRAGDWYIPYCQTALNLANQGYTVLVSSHREVREFLRTAPRPENVAAVVAFCPRTTMRDEWIERLRQRYARTGLEKDYRALANAEERFAENIMEIVGCGLPVYQPAAMDYNLKDYVYLLQQKAKKMEDEG